MNKKSLLPGIAWFFFTAVLLFLPGKDLPETDDWMSAIYFDKWVHAGIFGILSLSWLYPAWKANKKNGFNYSGWRNGLLIALISWALISECIQYFFVPSRQFDVGDIAADVAGTLIGLGFAGRFFR